MITELNLHPRIASCCNTDPLRLPAWVLETNRSKQMVSMVPHRIHRSLDKHWSLLWTLHNPVLRFYVYCPPYGSPDATRHPFHHRPPGCTQRHSSTRAATGKVPMKQTTSSWQDVVTLTVAGNTACTPFYWASKSPRLTTAQCEQRLKYGSFLALHIHESHDEEKIH